MSEQSLFNEALDKPPGERAAFLEEAFAGQPELRAAVESLLAAHEAAGSFLDRPAVQLGQTVDSDRGEAPLAPPASTLPGPHDSSDQQQPRDQECSHRYPLAC
jgi:hypothetical protein